MGQLRRAVRAEKPVLEGAKRSLDRRSDSRMRQGHPLRPKEDGRTTGHPGLHRARQRGGREGTLLCPEQSGDPWVGWLARLHVCPSPSAPNLCLAPSWARGPFCL